MSDTSESSEDQRDDDSWHLEGLGPRPNEDSAEDRARASRNAEAAARDRTCLRCGGQMESAGVVPFRVGGTTGKWKVLVGEWAELGEGLLELEIRRCNSCGYVELRTP